MDNMKIKFNKELIPWIKEGKKTSTLRLGLKDNLNLGYAYCVDKDNQNKIGCSVTINRLESFPLKEVRKRKDIVKSEGYSMWIELYSKLYEIYGEKILNEYDDINEDLTFTYIQFSKVQ